MRKEKLLLIEKKMNPIIKELVVEMKLNKVIDEQHVSQLLELLAEYKLNQSNEDDFSKEFFGKLFLLFSTLVLYAQYSNYNSKHMKEIFRLREGILDLFMDTR